MGLSKIRIGDYITQQKEKCNNPNLTCWDVSGVNKDKQFFEPSQQVGGDTSNYKTVPPNYFACNLMHIGRDCVMPIAMNNTSKNKIVSPAYTVFKLNNEKELLIKFLFILINSQEKDRYFWFHCDSSVRDGMEWSSFCDLEFDIPDVPTQQKYVDIYDAMCANQKAYEKGLDDLKLTCDAYIEELRRKMPCEQIGPYIQECNEKNDDNSISLFQGVNVDHEFTVPKRIADDKKNGNIVRTGQIAFNKVMKANGTKLPIALREGPDCVVSSSYQVFDINDKRKLSPEYFMLWMNRVETQRYAGFISFGTTRDIFSLDDMAEISIPVPDIKIQESIADIYKVYIERKRINEKLKQHIKNICPILIKGAIEEGKSKRG